MNIILLILFGLISGYGDSQGFYYASKIWEQQNTDYTSLIKALIGFSFGIGSYLLMTKFMHNLGITSTELQTITWFVVTIICIGFFSGDFLKWKLIDQIISVCVLVGIGWLFIRVH